MTVTCDWASCHNPATGEAGGWRFCRTHVYAHWQLDREEALVKFREARGTARMEMTFEAAVTHLHADGLSDEQIAALLRMAVATVRKTRIGLGHQSNRPPVAPQGCGTHAAFNRHKARGEAPCLPCREAERTYQRERGRVRRRKQVAA